MEEILTTDIKDFEKSGKRNKCKRPAKSATPEQLKETHRVKMEAKKILNAHYRDTHFDGRHVLANLSVNHEHFGDSPQEHEARKTSEKSS